MAKSTRSPYRAAGVGSAGGESKHMRIRRLRLFSALAGAAALATGTAAFAATPSASGGSALSPMLPAGVVAASAAPGSTWKPEKATYGTTTQKDIPVTMADGTVLRADVTYPTDASGAQAKGPFPVLLTQTPYGKGSGGADTYLVQRGYIEVVSDVRGTGDSEGSWGIFDPVQTTDSITLVRWAAKLPHSSGVVGTLGASYLGINQMLLAGAIGKDSPLKAIFPVVAGNDLYRDTSFMGGLIDAEFGNAYLGLTAGLNTANPIIDALSNPPSSAAGAAELAKVESEHAGGLGSYHAATTTDIVSGGPTAFDGNYWQARNPVNVLDKIVANNIPAYLVGGEFDIFQHGEPLNYAGLQNAFVGRPVTAPMAAGQPV